MKFKAFTGIQPSGSLHIGNFFSSIYPFLNLKNSTGESYGIMIADLHAMTSGASISTIIDTYKIIHAVSEAFKRQFIVFRQSKVMFIEALDTLSYNADVEIVESYTGFKSL